MWYRDLACLTAGAAELVLHSDRLDELKADADGRDPAALEEAVALVEDTRARLEFNVGEELACEALAYRLERLLGAERALVALPATFDPLRRPQIAGPRRSRMALPCGTPASWPGGACASPYPGQRHEKDHY